MNRSEEQKECNSYLLLLAHKRFFFSKKKRCHVLMEQIQVVQWEPDIIIAHC